MKVRCLPWIFAASLVIVVTVPVGCTGSADELRRMSTFDYPVRRRSDQADDYHGTIVADPYR